jgi:antitoxin (DNA-binding transcriptional repressor) of toxin-antitoxin stability system
MVMLTVSQARASLPELLTRVEEGEEVTITRHGRAVAVLVRPDVLRARAHVVIADALRIHELLGIAAASELPAEPGLTEQRAEELIAQIRADRDRR